MSMCMCWCNVKVCSALSNIVLEMYTVMYKEVSYTSPVQRVELYWLRIKRGIIPVMYKGANYAVYVQRDE